MKTLQSVVHSTSMVCCIKLLLVLHLSIYINPIHDVEASNIRKPLLVRLNVSSPPVSDLHIWVFSYLREGESEAITWLSLAHDSTPETAVAACLWDRRVGSWLPRLLSVSHSFPQYLSLQRGSLFLALFFFSSYRCRRIEFKRFFFACSWKHRIAAFVSIPAEPAWKKLC